MRGIVINGIKRTFPPDIRALKGIDLKVREGEFLTLLGPSGCGKSTLLRIIAGLEQMDSGELLYNGMDFASVPVQERKIGMVFQNYALFPNLTVLRNVMFGLEMAGINKTDARERAAGWIKKVHLEDKQDRYPHELSGGQQQRIALARALVTNPQLLLLDEPLSALDATVRYTLRNEIRQLQLELGITTVYVTHDQSEALSMSDRIAVLKDGNLIEVNTPSEIYGTPQNLFTAEFIGVSSRLDGVITSTQPCVARMENAFELELPPLCPGLKPGDEIAAILRAEDLKFASKTQENTIAGVVELQSFLGGNAQYKVKVSPDKSILIDLPKDGQPTPNTGDSVLIHAPQRVCHVYDKHSGASKISR